jgi:hypothetical protein
MSAETPALPRVRRALLVASITVSLGASACDQINEMLPWVRQQRAREQAEQAQREAEEQANRARAQANEANAAMERARAAAEEAAEAARRARESGSVPVPRYGAPPAFDALDHDLV